jgi:hypothetical protein
MQTFGRCEIAVEYESQQIDGYGGIVPRAWQKEQQVGPELSDRWGEGLPTNSWNENPLYSWNTSVEEARPGSNRWMDGWPHVARAT